ncbi:MAG: glutathione S-transferase family protein [Pseudomonadota bacterium]
MSAQDLILHHYPPSPVSEKIRAGLGLKGLTWHSVEQNRLPDRPELFALTGGYRRIPVLQLGADIYCDTQGILRALEARHPEPTFFPNGGAGLPFAVSRWTDNEIFGHAVRLAFAPDADKLPPALVADRARLYLGPDGDFLKERADLPHAAAQVRAHMGWVEDRLATGRPFILGDQPGMPDLMIYYLVWFMSGRWSGAETFFEEFPHIVAWKERMAALGHGTSHDMTPQQALTIARDAEPAAAAQDDPRDPQGLKVGQRISVAPLTDSGETAVDGTAHVIGRDVVAVMRETPEVGRVCVHFPRVGYRVQVL